MAKSKLLQRIAIGAALAGAAGYLAGLLTAPKSGKETRQDLSTAANNGFNDVEKQLREMQNELADILDDAKSRGDSLNGKAQDEFKSLVGKAKDSKEKMHKVMSAVHDGDANDKDLKKAMSDARHAIEHIKDFIQK
jgi:gas vesicle protein